MGCWASRKWKLILLELLLWLCQSCVVAETRMGNKDGEIGWCWTIVVDQNGNGDFWGVQDAIDSIPDHNVGKVIIQVNSGTYWEKIMVPKFKHFVQLQGSGRDNTVIVFDDTAARVGTNDSATITILGSMFIGKDITFQNVAPPAVPGARNMQACAAYIYADKVAFYNCGFIGNQDTLWDNVGRHYFKNCYIEGSIDFIFGLGQSIYDGCELHSNAQTFGSITAHARSNPYDPSGYVFLGCKIDGTGSQLLGRSWGPYSRVVYIHTYMANIISPTGWDNWDNPSNDNTVFYGQYHCSGPGSDESQRVWWSHELSEAEATPFMQLSFIDGNDWLPSTI